MAAAAAAADTRPELINSVQQQRKQLHAVGKISLNICLF